MGILRILCVVALLLGSWSAVAGSPSLLLNGEGIERLKERVGKEGEAKGQWDSLRQRVDQRMGEKLVLPPRGANWFHWYVCPEHGNRMEVGKRIGAWAWEHVCPVDNKVFRGDRGKVETDYDGCALAGEHSGNARLIVDAGLVYRVTGERKYFEKSREVLLAYAGKYAEYPLHTTRNEPKIGGGKVGSQTLDESVWLIPVTQGADLIWNDLSEGDRKIIAEKLLLPAARDVILPHEMGVHNIQCWKNSAVGLVGFLLKDDKLVWEAIEHPKRGHKVQMSKGVNGDGQWWEGAWGYHFYTVSAVLPLVEAARNNGIDLYGEELKKMFDGPLKMAMPNLVLPNFSDSAEVDLRRSSSVYEVAYARYGEEAYVGLLKGSSRRNDNALLYGVEELPEVKAVAKKGENFPAAGYAVLRHGEGEEGTWVCVKYGPHGGGHGHPDKLSFVLYAKGKVLSPDPGITSYGTPLHAGWYRTTVAHNTLTVDETSQKATEGKCIAFGRVEDPAAQYVIADAGKIAEGVRFVRTVVLFEKPVSLMVIDQVMSEKEHTYDVTYRQVGELVGAEKGEAWERPEKAGYRYLTEARVQRDRGVFEWKTPWGWGTELIVGKARGGLPEVITAKGIGRNAKDRVPTVIQRQRGTDVVFGSLVKLEPGGATDLELKSVGETSAAVETSAVEDGVRLEVIVDPSRTSISIRRK